MAVPLYGSLLEQQHLRQTAQVERENLYKTLLARVQHVPIPEEQKIGLLTRLGDILQTGTYATAGAAYAMEQGRSPFTGAWEGLTHKRKVTWSDVLKKAGIKESQARVIGLGLDIVLDPVTYIPFASMAKVIPGSKLVGKGLGSLARTEPVSKALGIFGVETKLSPVMKKLKTLYNLERESQKAVWLGRALQLAKKTPTTWQEIAERSLVDRAASVLKKGDILYAPDEMEKIVNILEETRRLPLSTLKSMGYDRELIHGAARYKKALREMFEAEKAAGIKIRELERYYPHILAEESVLWKEFPSKGPRGSKPGTKFTRKRTFPTIKVGTEKGYKYLPPEQAFALRALAHTRVTSYQNFLRNVFEEKASELGIVRATRKTVADMFGISTKELKELPPGKLIEMLNSRGLAEYTIEAPFKLPGKKYYAPKEIIDAIQRVEKLYSDSPAIRSFELGYDKMLNFWKSLATVINPGFHFRNTYSNWFNMWLAGVSPHHLPRLTSESLLVTMTKNKDAKIAGFTLDEIRKMVRKYGIHGKGWAATQYVQDPARVISDLFKTAGLRKYIPTNFMRHLGGMIEDNARVALFLDGLKKGMDPLDAAMRVKKFLFDYGELSALEKKFLRRLIPFYTWIRKNAPLQVEHLWTHTRHYAYIPKIKHAMEGTNTDIKPPYFEELYAMRLPDSLSKWLNKSGLPLYVNPNLPFQDLNRVFDPQDWLNSLGPWKIAFELALNKSIFTGAPLEMEKGQLVHRSWMSMVPMASKFFDFATIYNDKGEPVPALPGKIAHAIETAAPFLRNYGTSALWALGEGLQGTYIPGEGTKFEETKGWKALSHLAGIKLIPYNPRRERRAAAYRRRDALRAALYKARQINPYLVTSMVR